MVEVWYYWLALATMVYLLGHRRFSDNDAMKLLIDVVSLLLLGTGMVELVNAGYALAGIWLQVFAWAVVVRIVLYFFKDMLMDIAERMEDAFRWR